MRLEKGSTFPRTFKHFIRTCYPLYILLCTGRHEYRIYKTIAGSIYGFILGIGFYFLVIIDLDFTEEMAFFFGLLMCILIATGVAISTQIRCISLLTFPSFASKSGRGFLKAFIVALLISGPFENLMFNGREVVRVFVCASSLTFNITMARAKVQYQPFGEALIAIISKIGTVKDTLRNINDVYDPIFAEVEDQGEVKEIREENDYLDEQLDDTKRSEEIERSVEVLNLTKGEEENEYQKMYVKKIEERCEAEYTATTKKCRAKFSHVFRKCYDTVTYVAAWLLCWPLKLSFICNIKAALSANAACEPRKLIFPDFGKNYNFLKLAKDKLKKMFQRVIVQLKVDKHPVITNVKELKNVATEIIHEVTVKKEMLDQVLTYAKRILAALFFRVLIKCQDYHDKYLRDLEHDNVYITRYFRKIDARRHAVKKYTLLPLKKIERQKLLDPWSLTPIKGERQEIYKSCLRLLLEIIAASVLLILDKIVYEALDIVRTHAKISIIERGGRNIKLEIKGTGFMATILRVFIENLNVKKRIHIETNTDVCLPDPRKIEHYYIYKIVGLYFAIFLMIYFNGYTQRLRRLICSYFYRKREKKRILFLYNETLKRRMRFLKFMKNRVKQKAQEFRLKQNLNVCMILRIKYPGPCRFLHLFSYSRRKCLVCEEPETANFQGFVECPTSYCHMVYCEECWVDLKEKCFACVDVNADSGSESGSIEEPDPVED